MFAVFLKKGDIMQHRTDEPEAETMMLSQVPDWIEGRYGFRPNRSTVFRWKTRGCRGKKLKTFHVGGRVCTTVESLLEFFADDAAELANAATVPTDAAVDSYLAQEGI